MSVDYQNEMAQYEAERTRARERNTTAPYFFSINDGDSARVRLLLNFPQNVRMDYHQLYNKSEQKWEANAVCAKEFGQECLYCEQVKEMKDWKLKGKLKAQRHAYLPVYVHQVQHKQTDGSWTPVTYKEDGVEKPVGGVRMLDMKLFSSPILDALEAAYNQDADVPSERDIRRYDFIITRRGEGLETSYTVTPKIGAPLSLPDGLPVYTRDGIKIEIEKLRPMQLVNEAEDDSPDLGTYPF